MIRHVILITTAVFLSCVPARENYKPLRIINGAYVTLYPDMGPLRDQVTVCGWVRTSGDTTTTQLTRWFMYGHSSDNDEIDITSNGYYRILGGVVDKRTTVSPNVKAHEWHHHCLAWTGATSGTSKAKAYFDGEQLSEITVASGRRLTATQSGFVGLGDYFNSGGDPYGTGYKLNGDVLRVNLYRRELTHHEVKAIFRAGRCTRHEEANEDRYLKWEEIMKFYKSTSSRSVQEIVSDCPHIDDDDDDDDYVNGKGVFSMLLKKDLHDKILTEETLEDVYDRVSVLDDFVGVNMTEGIMLIWTSIIKL